METRQKIIQLADAYIRNRGFNAFSFYDISAEIGIKTASIHYHFPSKTDLAVAVIQFHLDNFNQIKEKYANASPLAKLERLFAIYADIRKEDKVCLVGSLATDYKTLDKKVRKKLETFSGTMLGWVSEWLEEGRNKNLFTFRGLPRTQAIMIISSLLAIVQLSRLTNGRDFKLVTEKIKQDLIKK